MAAGVLANVRTCVVAIAGFGNWCLRSSVGGTPPGGTRLTIRSSRDRFAAAELYGKLSQRRGRKALRLNSGVRCHAGRLVKSDMEFIQKGARPLDCSLLAILALTVPAAPTRPCDYLRSYIWCRMLVTTLPKLPTVQKDVVSCATTRPITYFRSSVGCQMRPLRC